MVAALAQLAPGGRLVINAIRKESHDQQALLGLRYETQLWQEKAITSVANVTRADVSGFLALAAGIGLRPTVQVYPFADANRALVELRTQPVRGSKVLCVAD